MLGPAAGKAEFRIGNQPPVPLGKAIELGSIGNLTRNRRLGMDLGKESGEVFGAIHVAELGDEAVDAQLR